MLIKLNSQGLLTCRYLNTKCVMIDNLREALFPNVMIVYNINISIYFATVQVSNYAFYYFSIFMISVYNITSSVGTSFFYTK